MRVDTPYGSARGRIPVPDGFWARLPSSLLKWCLSSIWLSPCHRHFTFPRTDSRVDWQIPLLCSWLALSVDLDLGVLRDLEPLVRCLLFAGGLRDRHVSDA